MDIIDELAEALRSLRPDPEFAPREFRDWAATIERVSAALVLVDVTQYGGTIGFDPVAFQRVASRPSRR